MKVDVEGRVFCTGSGGIWVIDPSGNRLGIICSPEVPRTWPSGDRTTGPSTPLPDNPCAA